MQQLWTAAMLASSSQIITVGRSIRRSECSVINHLERLMFRQFRNMYTPAASLTQIKAQRHLRWMQQHAVSWAGGGHEGAENERMWQLQQEAIQVRVIHEILPPYRRLERRSCRACVVTCMSVGCRRRGRLVRRRSTSWLYRCGIKT